LPRSGLGDVGGSWHSPDMTTTPISEIAERIVHEIASTVMKPSEGECLVCFVSRQLDDFGCDGTHRFALHYRDSVAPRATALLARLSAAGACCCDCEMFLNAYQPASRLWTPGFAESDADGYEYWQEE